MWIRIAISCFAVFIAGLAAAQEPSVDPSAGLWRPLRTGGGGWMTGLHIHPSGNPVFTRSDVGCAYRWDEESRVWTNVVTADSMPIEDVHWGKHQGVLSIVSAPSDPAVAYMAYLDCVYRGDSRGDRWERTNLPSIKMKPNDDSSKLAGERLAVDPANPNIAYFGSIDDGLWRTRDGGDSWTNIESVPKGLKDHGIRQVLFDTSTANGNSTNRIVSVVDGEGVFETLDAGKSWAKLDIGVEQPKFTDAEISAKGVVYICGTDGKGQTMHVRRYRENEWEQIFDRSGHTIGEIAIDPFDPNRAVLMTHGFSDTWVSSDLQSAKPMWNVKTYDRQAKSIPWLAWAQGGWFSLGEVVFDPSIKNRLWIASGTGTWMTSDLADENVTWVEATEGQEHLVSCDIVSLPKGQAITAHWDRPLFLHKDVNEFPMQHQPSQRFNSAWDLDRHPDDSDYIVAIVEDHRYCCYDDEHRNSGYSTDGGKTWTKFSSQPDVRGKESIHGQIAVSTSDRNNLVWLPAWNSMPFFTVDQGKSWTKVDLPGNSGNCCIAAPWFQREALAADRVLPSTFYIYDWAEGHLFQSTDGGESWQKFAAVLPPWSYHAKLRAVHGHAGHLWFAPGRQESVAHVGGLTRSVDGGETWTKLDNTNEVLNVSLGKALLGTDYPAIFIQGRVDGDFGYFVSSDQGAHWEKIGTYPLGIYDGAKVMHADAFQAGRLYVGFGGNGFVYFDANGAK
jgi:photosystem II stability/assembly factor-like uncharacterized protein